MARSARSQAGAASAARTATLVVLGANGFAFASWMSRLPDIREAKANPLAPNTTSVAVRAALAVRA